MGEPGGTIEVQVWSVRCCSLKEREWFAPVLEAFVRGLARPLANVAAPAGTVLRLTITGDAGGEWVALRQEDGWRLGTAPALTATATVVIDQEIAWRLFTKGIDRHEARQVAHTSGDPDLAERVFATVSILG